MFLSYSVSMSSIIIYTYPHRLFFRRHIYIYISLPPFGYIIIIAIFFSLMLPPIVFRFWSAIKKIKKIKILSDLSRLPLTFSPEVGLCGSQACTCCVEWVRRWKLFHSQSRVTGFYVSGAASPDQRNPHWKCISFGKSKLVFGTEALGNYAMVLYSRISGLRIIGVLRGRMLPSLSLTDFQG